MQRKRLLLPIVMALVFTLAASVTALARIDPLPDDTNASQHSGKLPPEFIWGVASSGFQSEGHTTEANWNHYITRDNGPTPVGGPKDPYGNSVDFFTNFEADIKRAAKLGVNVYRISINWTRVEPQPGQFSEEGLLFYDRVFATMQRYRIQPLITLNHWDYPLWVYQQGGWANSNTVHDFAALTTVLAKRYGNQVRFWLTFNEPPFAVLVERANSPLNDSQTAAMTANLIIAHQQAYAIIHSNSPRAMVSSNYAWSGRGPISSLESDRFLNAVRSQLDFAALDYYYPAYDQAQTLQQLSAGTPWNITLDPFGMYTALRSMHRDFPDLPILITENGMPTENGQPRADGVTRSDNMQDTLYWVQRARQDGVPVFGYVYWSLTDNYEWGSYAPRFGLYTVNVLTDPQLIRRPTDAVATYSRLIRDGGVPSAFRPTARPALTNCATASVAPEDRATCQTAAAGG
jgi:beta-glucosidase